MSYRTRPGAPLPFVYVGFSGHVVALRRDTGARIWMTKVGSETGRVAIVLEGDRVFALCYGPVCLDAATGQVLWTTDEPADTMAVQGDQVFLGNSGAVTCLSAVDGRRQWHNAFRGMGAGDIAFAIGDAAM